MPPQLQFGRGAIEHRKAVRVICHVGNESSSDDPTTTLLKWNGPGQPFSFFKLPWIANAITMQVRPGPSVFVLNSDGIVGLGYGTFSQETIHAAKGGPTDRGPLNDIRSIGGRIFAVGMSRQIYERDPVSGWHRIDENVALDIGDATVAGFNSISGLSDAHLWTVGFGGEIWLRTAGEWRRSESPTNLTLHRVIAIDRNLTYACGQVGVLLLNSGTGWIPVEHGATDDNLWDLAWFRNALYVSTEHGIFRLRDRNLESVSVPDVSTFGHLDVADGVLWSFGTRHICWTEDGIAWHDETPR